MASTASSFALASTMMSTSYVPSPKKSIHHATFSFFGV